MTPAELARRIEFSAEQIGNDGHGPLSVSLKARAKTVVLYDSAEVAAATVVLARADMIRTAEDLEASAHRIRKLATMIGES